MHPTAGASNIASQIFLQVSINLIAIWTVWGIHSFYFKGQKRRVKCIHHLFETSHSSFEAETFVLKFYVKIAENMLLFLLTFSKANSRNLQFVVNEGTGEKCYGFLKEREIGVGISGRMPRFHCCVFFLLLKEGHGDMWMSDDSLVGIIDILASSMILSQLIFHLLKAYFQVNITKNWPKRKSTPIKFKKILSLTIKNNYDHR